MALDTQVAIDLQVTVKAGSFADPGLDLAPADDPFFASSEHA
jgi:hypothetical protein